MATVIDNIKNHNAQKIFWQYEKKYLFDEVNSKRSWGIYENRLPVPEIGLLPGNFGWPEQPDKQ